MPPQREFGGRFDLYFQVKLRRRLLSARSLTPRRQNENHPPMTTHATSSLLRRGHMEWTVSASIVAWLVLLAVAFSCLTLHEFSTASDAPQAIVTSWPSESRIERGAGRPTLLLFLHPKCPCSRATLRELERVFANVPDNATELFVVATVRADGTDEWRDTVTMNAAQRLPNAELFIDPRGVEAGRFGATVSGQMMLFDRTGRRVFAGGVTPSRGHEGACPGADALVTVLRNETSQQREFPVYGCRLCLPDELMTSRHSVVIAATKQEPHP